MILSLEGFGGGECVGCVAATVSLDNQALKGLLEMAEGFKLRERRPIREVYSDPCITHWFVEWTGSEVESGEATEEIADFTQDASGYRVIEKQPGKSNLFTDTKTLSVTWNGHDVQFTWAALLHHTNVRVETCGVPESFLRGMSEKI